MTTDFFSQNGIKHIDYKDTEILKRFLNPNGRIKQRSQTGLSAKHQRNLATAIKRSRTMGLIPYIVS